MEKSIFLFKLHLTKVFRLALKFIIKKQFGNQYYETLKTNNYEIL